MRKIILILAMSLNACGIKMGPVVIGTTGFLEEANKGSVAEEIREKQISNKLSVRLADKGENGSSN